ncbi:hypothetical protein ENTCAN_07874 [Enterobacter cancerogenus ATCC 35316]|nr:hypothetical protein ENTCAN_07874 [Enterobacter cancerogenus ATCC 35316]
MPTASFFSRFGLTLLAVFAHRQQETNHISSHQLYIKFNYQKARLMFTLNM